MTKDMIKLGDVATYINGYAFKPEDRGEVGLPIIRIQDLTGNAYDLGFYDGEYPEKVEINDGDVLISWSASLGVYVWNRGRALLNQHIFKVVFDKVDIDKNYFVYAVRQKLVEMGMKTHGATMKHIVKKDFDATLIPYPSLNEQAEIATNLNKVSRVIEARKQELQLLDNLIKARFVEMFGDPIINPNAYKRITLNDACTKVTDGTHDTPERYEEGVLLLTGKNIRATGITFDDVEYVSEEDHRIIYDRCNPEYGDVLYTNIGVNYGTACFNNLDYEFSMKNVALLKPKRELLDGHYLWICLNYMRDYILSQNQVGGAQTFMGLATIKKISIPVPSINLQKQFAEFLVQIDKSKVAVKKALNEAQLLFDSLMQKYFS